MFLGFFISFFVFWFLTLLFTCLVFYWNLDVLDNIVIMSILPCRVLLFAPLLSGWLHYLSEALLSNFPSLHHH